jgi:hypothetical protein
VGTGGCNSPRLPDLLFGSSTGWSRPPRSDGAGTSQVQGEERIPGPTIVPNCRARRRLRQSTLPAATGSPAMTSGAADPSPPLCHATTKCHWAFQAYEARLPNRLCREFWDTRAQSRSGDDARHVQPGVRPASSIHFFSSGCCASSRVFTLMYRVRSAVPSGGGDSKSAPPRKRTFTEMS